MAEKYHEDNLDRAIFEIKSESIPADALEASARRVRTRVEAVAGGAAGAAEPSAGCLEIRAALPALRHGDLTPARRLLVETHLRECASCRALAAGQEDPVATAAAWRLDPSTRQAQRVMSRYAWAAAAVIVFSAAAWILSSHYYFGPAASRVRLVSLSGHAYRVSPASESPLHPGDVVEADSSIRTGADSRAVVLLADGSRVEMNGRTEFSISAAFRRTSLHLEQGDIIVQAPPRTWGRLLVTTADCTVTDKGTIFAVDSGMKGSRVGVVEGSVSVTHDGTDSVLGAGDSLSTPQQTVSAVPVSSQIGWSGDREHYLALLDEFSRLGRRLEQIPPPQPRYQSRILTLVPANASLYFSIPNLGDTLQQADSIFHEELSRSTDLRQWWNGIAGKNGANSTEEMIGKLEVFSHYLGDEVVLIAAPGAKNSGEGPLLLAPIVKPGLEEFLKSQMASSAGTTRSQGLQVVDENSLGSLPPRTHRLTALVRSDMLVIGGDPAAVRRMNHQLDAGPSGFVKTDFGRQIEDVYRSGAQTLFAANLQGLMAQAKNHHPHEIGRAKAARPEQSGFLRESGFGEVKFLIATHGKVSGQTQTRAVVEFAGDRRGIASWLGAPGPMGSLDFVSADAGAAVSVVTKRPAKMFDDVLQLISLQEPDVKQKLAAQEAPLGLDLRNDLAEALGGEFTFALDGPLLPKPAWKAVVEVNDPAGLQKSIATLLQRANMAKSGSQGGGLELSQNEEGGRTFYTLHSSNGSALFDVVYTYADGYLVAAPSRALVMAALATRSRGNSLSASAAFRSLLPRDGHTNLSGVMYENLGPLVAPILSEFNSGEAAALQRLAANAQPGAICAYGDSDRVEVASTANVLSFQPGVATLLKLLGAQDRGTFKRPMP